MWIKFSKKNDQASDQDMLNQFQWNGDPHILITLYDRYIELVYGVALKYLQDEDLCKDVVMDIYVHISEKLKSQEVSNFKSWIHVVTKNHCLEILRKRKRRKTDLISHESVQNLNIQHHDISFEIMEENTVLKNCMRILSPKQKVCIAEFYYEEKTYKAIAIDLELTINSVRSFIQNGRRKLKKCLEKKMTSNE